MKMTRARRAMAGFLVVLGAAGCTDLDVTNPNAPDSDRALRLAGDVESLISGSFLQWWNSQQTVDGLGMMESIQSFQHSAYPANFGMYYYSEYPRAEVRNNPATTEYLQHATPWTFNYRAIAAIRDGLIAINSGAVDLGANTRRAQAFGKLVQGLAYGTLALNYDQAFIVDEDVTAAQIEAGIAPVGYNAVMTAAIAYLDEAIVLANGGTFNVPAEWTSQAMTSVQLARLARSYKASFRANVARNPAERAAVNWAQVLVDAELGVTQDWQMNIDWTTWNHNVGYYMTLHTTWAQQSYQMVGMADQSGKYQTWINLPIAQRHPILPGAVDFTIITPDLRFPQGATLAAQRAAPGRFYQAVASPSWARPDRGTYRWSYYGDQRFRSWRTNDGLFPWMTRAELRLLAAEGLFRTGQLQKAADSVNVSRVFNGLNATNSAGLNTSCVPKLPNGSCGNLFEMLKWEKRLETQFQGNQGAPWYFDGRGWGDLYRGTQLQFPMPCREAQVLQMDCYTFGGVGGLSAAPLSTYAFNGE
jgi:hypothetical protein